MDICKDRFIPYERETELQYNAGALRKAELGKRQMKICPQAVRLLEGWVAKKKEIRTQSVMSNRKAQSVEAKRPTAFAKTSRNSVDESLNLTVGVSTRPQTMHERRDVLRGVIPYNNSPIKSKAYATELVPKSILEK